MATFFGKNAKGGKLIIERSDESSRMIASDSSGNTIHVTSGTTLAEDQTLVIEGK